MSGSSKSIIGAFLVALGIFLSWAWTLPNYQAASALGDVAEEKELDLQQKTEIVEKIKSWHRQYESKRDEISRFQQIIPKEKNIGEIINVIEKVAGESGIQVLSLEVSEKKGNAADKFDTISIIINGSGTYPSLGSVLTQLEKNIRLLDVTELEISKSNDSSAGASSNLLSLRISVDAYVAKEVTAQRQQQ